MRRSCDGTVGMKCEKISMVMSVRRNYFNRPINGFSLMNPYEVNVKTQKVHGGGALFPSPH